MSSVFSKIIAGELPCKKVYEDENILAFHDIHPVAPVHLLIVSKKEIANLQSVSREDLPLIGEMVAVAQQLAEEFEVQDGYRLLTNVGRSAGQTIFHLHFHLIGGRPLGILG